MTVTSRNSDEVAQVAPTLRGVRSADSPTIAKFITMSDKVTSSEVSR